MKTKTKIFMASIAYGAVSKARRLIGRGSLATVSRGGVRWQLDLAEGIDFSIYLLGGFERSTGVALDGLVRPGDTIFDIGANIGAHTLPMARRVGIDGRVFAFEPSGFAFEKLKKNIFLNPDLQDRVIAHQILLRDGLQLPLEETIYASWPLVNSGSVHPKHRGRLTTTLGASADTIDSFTERQQIGRLDLIKIDVDGNEYSALNGGIRTLSKLRPLLLMELSPYVYDEQGKNFASLINLLRSLGYSLEKVGTRRQLPLLADELEKLIPDGASINVIAHPDERGR